MTKMEKDSPIYRHCIDSVSNLFKEERGEDPKYINFPMKSFSNPLHCLFLSICFLSLVLPKYSIQIRKISFIQHEGDELLSKASTRLYHSKT